MFFRFIENLQNKSEQQRKVVTLATTSVLFVLIFIIWLTTFQLNSEHIENEEMYNKLSPLASLKEMSARFIKDVKNSFGVSDNTLSGTESSNVMVSPDISATVSDPSAPYELLNVGIVGVGTTTEDQGHFLEGTGSGSTYGTSSNE